MKQSNVVEACAFVLALCAIKIAFRFETFFDWGVATFSVFSIYTIQTIVEWHVYQTVIRAFVKIFSKEDGSDPIQPIDEDLRRTAFHEAGHVLLSWKRPLATRISEATIIPNGDTLGECTPETEDEGHSKAHLRDTIIMYLGGFVAEQIVFGENTRGQGNDLEQATEIAREMVMEEAMSEDVGFRYYDVDDQATFGNETREQINAAIIKILKECRDEAQRTIETHRDELEKLANEILCKRTLTKRDFVRILGEPTSN